VHDPEVNRYITLLGDSLSRVADQRNLDWHFSVVDSRDGHVTRRHSIRQLQKSQGTSMGATLLCTLTAACNSSLAQSGINLAANAAFAKFSRTDEVEADEEGVRYLIKAHIDPLGNRTAAVSSPLYDLRRTTSANGQLPGR
jgi:predicted Zn-dependent protease